MPIDAETQEEITRLDQAVDEFAAEMKARLREQAMKGYRGQGNRIRQLRYTFRRGMRKTT
jgi:hypothetical protein